MSISVRYMRILSSMICHSVRLHPRRDFRQGVADLIKRCNKKLLDYEAKLHLVEKFMSIKSDIRKIHELTNDFKKSHNELLMNEIEAISNQILEEL